MGLATYEDVPDHRKLILHFLEKLVDERGGILQLTEGCGHNQRDWEEKMWSLVLQQCCQDEKIQELINREPHHLGLCSHKNYHHLVRKNRSFMKRVRAVNGNIKQMCCDKYGSRVVEAFIEEADDKEMAEFVEQFQEEAENEIQSLCTQQFSSYVMKKLVDKTLFLDGWFENMVLAKDGIIQELASDKYGSFVVEALFDSDDHIVVQRVASLLIENFADLAKMPHGGSHVAARFAKNKIPHDIQKRAEEILLKQTADTWPEHVRSAFGL